MKKPFIIYISILCVLLSISSCNLLRNPESIAERMLGYWKVTQYCLYKDGRAIKTWSGDTGSFLTIKKIGEIITDNGVVYYDPIFYEIVEDKVTLSRKSYKVGWECVYRIESIDDELLMASTTFNPNWFGGMAGSTNSEYLDIVNQFSRDSLRSHQERFRFLGSEKAIPCDSLTLVLTRVAEE